MHSREECQTILGKESIFTGLLSEYQLNCTELNAETFMGFFSPAPQHVLCKLLQQPLPMKGVQKQELSSGEEE